MPHYLTYIYSKDNIWDWVFNKVWSLNSGQLGYNALLGLEYMYVVAQVGLLIQVLLSTGFTVKYFQILNKFYFHNGGWQPS